jgi:hypothetical protein
MPARWTSAALAAPVAAAVFAGTTAYASDHDPLAAVAAPPKPAVVPAPSPPADPVLASLQRQLAANRRTLASLARQVAAVRVQAAALRQPGRAATPRATSRPTGGGTAGTVTRTSTVVVPAPAAIPAAAAPAPATHTTTGASGAPK